MNTKIYCDIAELNQLESLIKKIVKGFTTNPSLMRKAGVKDYKNYSKNILRICKKPVSLEVFGDKFDEMIKQGLKISTWGENVYVKIPIVNSRGKFTGKVIKRLNQKKIKLNITAVYNSNQTKKILNVIDKKTKVIISIFVGRAADVGKDPIPEIKRSISISKKYKNVEILWASVREPYNFIQAKKLGCSIITIPPSMIGKIEKFGKSYQDLTINTVKALIDSKKSKFRI